VYYVKGKYKETGIILQSDTLARVYIHYIRNGEFWDYCGVLANGMASAWKEYALIREYRKDFLRLLLNFWKIRGVAAIFHDNCSDQIGNANANIVCGTLYQVSVRRGKVC